MSGKARTYEWLPQLTIDVVECGLVKNWIDGMKELPVALQQTVR